MSKEFTLPELGENITAADVLQVLIKPGDKVAVDQTILEIETDKATIEVPSSVSGVVKEVNVKAGDKAKVGQVIFTVDDAQDGAASAAKAEQTKAEQTKAESVDKSRNLSEESKEMLSERREETKKQATQTKQQPKAEAEVRAKTEGGKGGIIEFKLPELGENIVQADVLQVKVKPGDKLEKDQIILEIETDKATIEVPSDISGTVKDVNVKAGDKAKVGQVMITVELAGGAKQPEQSSKMEEADLRLADRITDAETTDRTVAPEQVTPFKGEVKSQTEKSQAEKPAQAPKAKFYIAEETSKLDPDKIAPAAPTVRRFAREIGVNINEVPGSGPGGRISIADVKAYSRELRQRQKTATEAPAAFGGIPSEPLPDFAKWGQVERKDMSNIRRRTAEHLSFAWATAPQVTQYDKADITELERLRKTYGKRAETEGGKLTVTAVLLKVVASALKAFPQFNSSVDLQNSSVIYKKYYNIGVAVDTDRGLLVPVIKDVDKKNIIELSVELNKMAEKARNKKLSLDEMQGGTFTITNLGGIGGTYFSPIVNTPEVAILGVSRSVYEPVFIDNEFRPRLMLPLSLSYDHRIIDGADGARFLKWIADAIQTPFLMALEG